jgi:DNA-3-methyladenine glycosylase I
MGKKVIPPSKKPIDDKGYLEILSKAVFNAGFSYQVVNSKWVGIKEIFHEFDPEILSNWTINEVTSALKSPKIIRNYRKVNAIVANAKIFLDIIKEHKSFVNYIKSFRNKPYEERQKIISNRFKWLGPAGAHFFLWSVGEEAPSCEQII